KLVQEPRIYFRNLIDLLALYTEFYSVAEVEDHIGAALREAFADDFHRADFFYLIHFVYFEFVFVVGAETGARLLEGADGFLKSFFECSAEGHNFADRFHLHAEQRAGGFQTFELFEIPARNFHDAIIYRRLEAGWRLLGNIVWNFIER